jgi:hypothetical protein
VLYVVYAFMVCTRTNSLSEHTQSIEHYAYMYNMFQPLSGRNYNDIKVFMRFHYYLFIELKVNTIFLSTTVKGRPPPRHTLPFYPVMT